MDYRHPQESFELESRLPLCESDSLEGLVHKARTEQNCKLTFEELKISESPRTPTNVERLGEKGKMFLRVTCRSPAASARLIPPCPERPTYILLYFGDSRTDLELWENALLKLAGKEPHPPRRSTDSATDLRKKKDNYSEKKHMSSLEVYTLDEISLPGSLHSLDGDSRGVMMSMMHSERDEESTTISVTKRDVNGTTFTSYKGEVFVSGAGGGTLYVGDLLLLVRGRQVTCAARAVSELRHALSSSSEAPVQVTLRRFPHGTMSTIQREIHSWNELGISVDGPEITTMHSGEPFRASLDPAKTCFESRKSRRSITRINNYPVSLDSSSAEVINLVEVAISEEQPIIFHTHPRLFLETLDSLPGSATFL